MNRKERREAHRRIQQAKISHATGKPFSPEAKAEAHRIVDEAASPRESAVTPERAVTREGTAVPERAVQLEGTAEEERAVPSEGTASPERAVAIESTEGRERATAVEGTDPGERAESGERAVHSERAAQAEGIGEPERAVRAESPVTDERAVLHDGTENHERAGSRESTATTERAVSNERTEDAERAESAESTATEERLPVLGTAADLLPSEEEVPPEPGPPIPGDRHGPFIVQRQPGYGDGWRDLIMRGEFIEPVGVWLAREHPTMPGPALAEMLVTMGLPENRAVTYGRQRQGRDAMDIASHPAVVTLEQNEERHRKQKDAFARAYVEARKKADKK